MSLFRLKYTFVGKKRSFVVEKTVVKRVLNTYLNKINCSGKKSGIEQRKIEVLNELVGKEMKKN